MNMRKFPLWLAVCAIGTAAVAQADEAAFDCLIEPRVVAEIGSPVQGVLKELLVDRSDMVTVGQPIAALNSDVELAALEQARARAATQSEIAAREADLELAKLNLKRTKELHDQNLIPEQQRDEARARMRVARASLVQALEKAQLQQLELQRSQQLVAQRTIRSPYEGVVVEQTAFPGEFVYDNPIMTIAQLNPLRVEVVLPARLFGQFKPGDQARIHPEVSSGTALVAEVEVVDRLLDTRSGTFGMRLALDNPDLAIVGGQKCRIDFRTTTAAAKEG